MAPRQGRPARHCQGGGWAYAPPWGDAGVKENRRPAVGRAPREHCLHNSHHVARPPFPWTVSKPSCQCRGLRERKLDAEEIPATVPTAHNVTAPLRLRLDCRARRTRERELEHTRAAVVRDPSHDVESPRRARDVERPRGRVAKERSQARIGLAGQGSQPIQGGLKPGHRNKPRRRSAACNTGSIERRSPSFAYPTHATSVVTSSGASSGFPAGSVRITPASRAISDAQRS